LHHINEDQNDISIKQYYSRGSGGAPGHTIEG